MGHVDGVPYMAVGNEELKDAPPLKPGDKIMCRKCQEAHVVKDSKPGGLFWTKCNDGKARLVGIQKGFLASRS